MALRRSTARRYAEAAYEVAVRDDAVEAWLAALAAADEALYEAKDAGRNRSVVSRRPSQASEDDVPSGTERRFS